MSDENEVADTAQITSSIPSTQGIVALNTTPSSPQDHGISESRGDHAVIDVDQQDSDDDVVVVSDWNPNLRAPLLPASSPASPHAILVRLRHVADS